MVAEVWKHLPDEARAIYKDRADADKDRFDREILAETIVNGGKKLFCVTVKARMRGKKGLGDIRETEKAPPNVNIENRFMHYKELREAELRQQP